MLKECIDFVRDHLGRVDCNDSHSTIGDGVKLNNIAICRLLVKLGNFCFLISRSCETGNHAISYLSEARELLVQRKDAGNDDMVMWDLLFDCDKYLGPLYGKIGQMEKARYHAVQLIATAREYKGPDQADRLIAALSFLSKVLFVESKLPEP